MGIGQRTRHAVANLAIMHKQALLQLQGLFVHSCSSSRGLPLCWWTAASSRTSVRAGPWRPAAEA